MPDKKVPTSRAERPRAPRSTGTTPPRSRWTRLPDVAYTAILNVRGWWSGDIEGRTDKVGEEWTYRFEDIHYSKQRVTELVPGKKVVWLVLDSRLSFVKDQSEWNETRVRSPRRSEGRQDGGHLHPRRARPGAGVLQRLLGRMGLVHSGSLRASSPPGRASRTRRGDPPLPGAIGPASGGVGRHFSPRGPAGRARSVTRLRDRSDARGRCSGSNLREQDGGPNRQQESDRRVGAHDCQGERRPPRASAATTSTMPTSTATNHRAVGDADRTRIPNSAWDNEVGPAEGTEVVTFTSDSREGGAAPWPSTDFKAKGPRGPPKRLRRGSASELP